MVPRDGIEPPTRGFSDAGSGYYLTRYSAFLAVGLGRPPPGIPYKSQY